VRVFLVSVEHPHVRFEVVTYDKTRGRIVLRGEYDSYESVWPGPPEVQAKRKLNWRMEKCDAEFPELRP
jgi:hypothetical protein